jgi:ComF family protein
VLAAAVRGALASVAPADLLRLRRQRPIRGPLCAACRSGLPWLPSELVPLGAADGASVDAWAPLAYRGGAAALTRALKFRGALALAEAMAAQIVANAPAGGLDRGVLVPVPLHAARRRRRGFNQAERLARELGRRTGLPVSDCLRRGGARGTQMGRDRDARLAALSGAITVRSGAPAPREAVLVDDVLTTGATVLACAAALRAAGAERVTAVAYARTPGR